MSGARASTRVAAFAAFAWLLLTVATAAAQADPPDGRFTATLDTHETFRFDRKRCPALPYLAGTTTGQGTAVPFGAITARGSDCVRPIGARTFAFSRGKLTMTTADGDALYADYSGRLARSPTLRIDRIVGAFVITGGTGRFAGTAGSGTITGTENLLTRRGQLVFEGTVRR